MMSEDFTSAFREALDFLVRESELVIDRPKGTLHHGYAHFIFPVDYGFLKGTTSMDGGGIDVWRGSDPSLKIDAIMCTIDLPKKDTEIKVLIGCTTDEK